jgi:hypothetical protein
VVKQNSPGNTAVVRAGAKGYASFRLATKSSWHCNPGATPFLAPATILRPLDIE